MQFLSESKLLEIISLSHANLSDTNLNYANLRRACLVLFGEDMMMLNQL